MLKKIKNKFYIYLVLTFIVLSLTACSDNAGGLSDIKQNSSPLTSSNVSETQGASAEDISSQPQSASGESSVSKKEDTASKNTEITSEKALEIALSDAGVKKSDAREIDIDLDDDNALKVYEIGFESAGFEYSYEIDAVSGAILQREKEADK